MDGFTVTIGEVLAHAATAEAQAARADVAAEAGAHLSSLDDAYGLFCQPFGQMLVEPQQRGTDAITKAAAALHGLTESLEQAAAEYQAVDEKVTAVLDALVAQLDAAAGMIPSVGGN
ncbi:hypothetical protein UO65_6372 [Actinokineospora spheciospongiae]|uniref:ESX-1 secretion-associated protein n=1 Tax=Actinokineospora spheciospongiae TaxID=909613 RepID=W7ICH5_9PSEU|nr:type VII secretion target [Actinokineospora spheciospongiae]EWC58480.1 hypothetical protein UO65_6372 [Actinokineospora spheciospongiae]PWW61845.1 excreted virulence factor EspC (type VII ESX diderm) [Actinokineospora spheciospongiae]